ncbi:hypothetical protein V7358_13660 [Bacillus pumilus]|uniref:hypothetical protein n=1 Tax=Bacillus pumilus TaxID=1408 RepID=UPI002FFFBBAF
MFYDRVPWPTHPTTTSPIPPHIMSQYQTLVKNPSLATSSLVQGAPGQGYAVGCEKKWTIVYVKSGQIFLMYVLSTNLFGNTTGIIYPTYSFGSFPTSEIVAYLC